ncbi:MAG: hypothetical protein MRY63_04275 [Neomegalonema sp.]|nr:hypothetical protein [Neomegalonema sp.]
MSVPQIPPPQIPPPWADDPSATLLSYERIELPIDLLDRAELAGVGMVAQAAALRLIWAAHQSRPAGCLADDDIALARLAGFGEAVARWQRVRAAALRGFKADDCGRLWCVLILPEIAAGLGRRIEHRADAVDRQRRRRVRSQLAAIGVPAATIETPGLDVAVLESLTARGKKLTREAVLMIASEMGLLPRLEDGNVIAPLFMRKTVTPVTDCHVTGVTVRDTGPPGAARAGGGGSKKT